METPELASAWVSGYEQGIDEAIRLVDGMRGPRSSNLSSPILLRLRAELLALRHDKRMDAAA